MALPIIFYAGPLRLSPYRLVLILAFIPCLIGWLSGASGKIRSPDVLILLLCLWGMVAVTFNHGLAFAIEPSGIFLIETFGSYLLARVYIRNVYSFRTTVSVLFYMLLFILPFAVFQSFTSRPLLLDVLDNFFVVIRGSVMEPRLGLHRAQGAFEHPILYGVISASVFSVSYYAQRKRNLIFGKITRSITIASAVFFSLSTGAFVALASQIMLITWDKFTKSIPHRWIALIVLFFSAYALVDIISNRTPFEVFISYLTFNVGNSYNRVLIWQFGTSEVFRNPIFGIGYNEWIRPYWMSNSMDNFWLLNAVRYGFPGFGFLATAVLIIFIKLGNARNLNENVAACRKGLLISLVGLSVAAATVHLWNASYSLFMFFLGSGMWMLDVEVLAKEYRPKEAEADKEGASNLANNRFKLLGRSN